MRARGTNRKSALACRTESVIAFFQMRGTRDKFPAPVTAPEARSDAFIERDYRNVWSAAELQAKNEQWQLVCANVFGL